MAYSDPGPYNTFTANSEATGNMLSAYGRNTKDWAINRIMELRPVTKSKGYYLRWKSQQAARVRYSDGREFAWADAADRPTGQDNLEQFEFEPYTTTRFAPSFTMGRKTVEQADWALQDAQTQVIGQQMMTLRTLKGLDALANASWGANQANVDGAGGNLNGNAPILASGQNLGNGTINTPNIKKVIQYVMLAITKTAIGAVDSRDLVFYMGPEAATNMSQSQEVQAYLAQSPFALANITGGVENQNAQWGLPPSLYGVRIEVERTVQNTNRKGASSPGSAFAMGSDICYILTQQKRRGKDGELSFVGPNMVDGAEAEDRKENYFPTLSTLVGFFYEEFTVETRDDPWNRIVQGSVVSDFSMNVSSTLGAFQLQDCFG